MDTSGAPDALTYAHGMRKKSPVVRLTVSNVTARPADLVLEPLGEVHVIPAGEQRTVIYSGDREPTLSIDFGDEEIKIWEEGPGQLDMTE